MRRSRRAPASAASERAARQEAAAPPATMRPRWRRTETLPRQRACNAMPSSASRSASLGNRRVVDALDVRKREARLGSVHAAVLERRAGGGQERQAEATQIAQTVAFGKELATPILDDLILDVRGRGARRKYVWRYTRRPCAGVVDRSHCRCEIARRRCILGDDELRFSVARDAHGRCNS